MADDKVYVDQIRSAIQQQGGGWQAAENPISELPRDQRLLRLGVKPPPGAMTIEEVEKRVQERRQSLAEEVGSITAPAAYDLRNVGGQNYVTSIKNQGGCGSCVAFGTAATVESTFRVQRGNAGLAIDLSEAQLFYCYARSEGNNCGTGWWPQNSFNFFQSSGVSDEACYPYTASDQNCTNLCGDWQSRVTKITGQTVLTGNPAGMKEWISTKGALSACFIVYDDFFAYSSGVYKHVSGAQAGGHCVSIVGYSNSQGCWIAKNSWGTSWGESGFFRIAYGDCGIDSWDVRGVNGIEETGWQNNKKILGLWAINQDRNAWVYVQDLGWRKIAADNDNIFFDMLTQLATAKSANRPVNVYQQSSIITQVYVF